ncbi:hypothetical protein [Micromonospora sp. URMC 103]|uniref:hypothetical protein n=1 Tax=Micromonospora sp. URMC 103 TaxID=3423406 RepID=UPI003F1B58F5
MSTPHIDALAAAGTRFDDEPGRPVRRDDEQPTPFGGPQHDHGGAERPYGRRCRSTESFEGHA